MPKGQLLLFSIFVVFGGLPTGVAQGGGPPERSPLAVLQHAIGEDDAKTAQKVVERACREGTASDQAAAKLLAGRVWLMHGNASAFRKYLAHMRGTPIDGDAEQLLSGYEAWALALDGRTEEARAALDALLEASTSLPSTADVAEILAQVHLLRQDAQGVRDAIAFGRKFAEYHDLLSPHLAKLFQRRLAQAAELGKDPAAAIFQKAENARKTRKWATAISLYDKVGRDHPSSELRHPARFWQAECWRADGKLSSSIEIWKAFIAHDSQGPWRGQANVGLIDISLEDSPNLDLATTQVSLALAASRQPIAPAAAESWNRAITDLHVRAGLIALVEHRHEAAAEAFESAEQSLRERSVSRGDGWNEEALRRLAAFAKTKLPLAPQDALSRDERTSMRLLLGCAYDAAQRGDKVLILLEPLAIGRSPSLAAGQQSYARLVLARLSESQGRWKDAVLGYRQSIEAFPTGSWHDETLHRQAQIMERLASDASAEPTAGSASQTTRAAPSTAADRERARQARRTHAAVALTARGKSLPVWLELVAKYPKSPRAEPALFHAGKLAAALERRDEAADFWQRQLAQAPDGVYAGVCHVEMAKLRLEHFFDLAGAEAEVNAGLAWYAAAQRHAGIGDVTTTAPGLPADWPSDPLLRPTGHVGHDLLVQAGLVAYLKGRREEAVEFFRRARPLEAAATPVDPANRPPTGIGRLLAAAEDNEELVPPDVLDGNDQAKLCLQLASCYYVSEDFSRVLELTERVMERMPQAKPHQRAWARFLHGRACHSLWLPLDALDDFSKAVAEAPRASWAPQCQFFIANSTFSYAKDIPAAIAAWQQLVNRYPESELVERATYHIGFAYQASAQYKLARESYEAFVKKYPTSPFTKAIERHHLPELQASDLTPVQ